MSDASPYSGSAYDPAWPGEAQRLQIQAQRWQRLDLDMLRLGLGRVRRGNLLALDLGCGSGAVALDCLTVWPQIALVLGLDRSPEALSSAPQHPKLRLQQADLDSPHLEQQLRDLLGQLGRQRIDLVLACLSLHHLADPLSTLQQILPLLAQDGFVAVRSKDDGLRLAYPDPQQRVKHLNDSSLPGQADRHFARKVPQLLTRVGLTDIRLLSQSCSSADLDSQQRQGLFDEAFGWRRHYWEQALQQQPDDRSAQAQLQQLDQELQALSRELVAGELLYMETSLGWVASVGP